MTRIMFIVLPFISAVLLVTAGTGTVPAPPTPTVVAIDTALIAQPLPDQPWLAIKELLRRGDGASAEARLAAISKDHPEISPWIKFYTAEARLLQNDRDGAISLYLESASLKDRAIALKSLDRLAEIFRTEKNLDKALACRLDVASRLTGDAARMEKIRVAECMIEGGRTSDAIALLVGVMRERGSPQVASSAAAVLLRVTTPNRTMQNEIANIFYEGGEFSRAADLYKAAGSTSPDIAYRHARALERADRFREAIEVYKSIRSSWPAYAVATVRYRIGLCYQRIGQDAEGERYFQEILASDPRSSLGDDILYRMATRRDQKDKRDEALALYRRLLKEHPRSSWADEAAWKIGLAYLEDDRPQNAEEAFRTALKRYPRSDYAPAMGYWRGKILETSRRYDDAMEQYVSILEKTSDPYYRGRASIAFRKLGGTYSEADLDRAIEESRSGDLPAALGKMRAIRDAAEGPLADRAHAAAKDAMARIGYWGDLARFSNDAIDASAIFYDAADNDSPIIRELEGLVAIGAYEEAAAELSSLNFDAGVRPERQLAMTRLLAEGGAYRSAMRGIESLVRTLGGPRDPAAMPNAAASLLYPKYYGEIVQREAAKYNLDYRFVLAVMREESRFQADVSSWAGAQGLMQIMPTTGAGLAKQLDITPFHREMLLDPKVNIAMGTYFLNQLLKQYDGNKYLALAGYNAGPGNANRWIRQNPGVAEEFLIEKITFRETRNYVKRVLGTYWTYRQIDGDPVG